MMMSGGPDLAAVPGRCFAHSIYVTVTVFKPDRGLAMMMPIMNDIVVVSGGPDRAAVPGRCSAHIKYDTVAVFNVVSKFPVTCEAVG